MAESARYYRGVFQMQQTDYPARRENFWRKPPDTLVTLTHPPPLVTFRLNPGLRCFAGVEGRIPYPDSR